MKTRNRLFSLAICLGLVLSMVAVAQVWKPYPGQQTRFLASPAFETLFGGAAGPGKTECGVMEALRQVAHPLYTGVIFRRTYQQLGDARGPISRSLLWYPAYGGTYNRSEHVWTFPSGAQIFFRYLDSDADLENYQGAQYAYLFFDELTQFSERQYLYLFSRCRVDNDSGLRAYIRSATNPTGSGKSWVKKRFITQDIVNKIAYFTRVNDVDTRVDKTHPDGKSRSFIPATHKDNPKISRDYIANLKQLNEVEQLQLLHGDWDAEDSSDRVYPNWSSLVNVTTEAEYKPGEWVWWGYDDGYVYGQGPGSVSYHPRVVLLSQVNHLGGLDVFDEYYSTGEASYDTTIDNVLAKGYARPAAAYGDSSAAMFSGNLKMRGIMSAGATHEVLEGIRNLRRMIKDGNGVVLFRVHPRCTQLIEEMSAYQYEPRSQVQGGDRKPLKVDDHGPDVARYLAWQLRHGKTW